MTTTDESMQKTVVLIMILTTFGFQQLHARPCCFSFKKIAIGLGTGVAGIVGALSAYMHMGNSDVNSDPLLMPPTSSDEALFHSGYESFALLDENLKAPTAVLFDKNFKQKMMSFAINQVLKNNESIAENKAKMPGGYSLQFPLKGFLLEPNPQDPTQLNVRIIGDLYESELAATISREDFVTGKPISIKMPPEKKEVSGVGEVKMFAELGFQLSKDRKLENVSVLFDLAIGDSEDMHDKVELAKITGTRGKAPRKPVKLLKLE